MFNPKRSITLKVVAGYLIVAVLAGFSVWYIYNQVIAYSRIAQSNTANNKQLLLVSEITTDLNQSENTSRRLIQTGNEEELDSYNSQINSIKYKLRRLEDSYEKSSLENEVEKISELLEQKTENLKELVALRDTDRNTNYYSRVLRELKKVDESFADENYEQRFANLEPHQRRVLIKLLEYAKEDNAQELTNQRLDSLVTSVKKVLTELEIANRQFRNEVNEKENALLNNDMILNRRLRNLLSGLEQKERENSLERAEVFQNMLEKTSNIIIIGGCILILIILFFIFNIIGDVTRSQGYRMQLEEAKVFAESLLASREQFMAAITHDLRSPLTTVMGYTDLIQKTELNEKQKHYLLQIKKSSNFILRLVNDLLDLSKLEAGKMLIEKLPFNPKKLIQDTVNNIIPAEKDKDVEIKIEVDPETNAQFQSDPFRIKQILANLISNAWKFTEKGEIVITADLRKLAVDEHLLSISVKDSGIGISEEMQESIFEEFSQEDSSIEKRFGGSGLGLAITKRLTELLKGDISVNSKQGEGSEFIIHIPVTKLRETRQEKEHNGKKTSLSENFEDKAKKALIVDDEPGQLSLTAELTKSLGFEIETASNGKIAIEKLEKAPSQYGIVLTDIQMPVADGFKLIEKIRNTIELQDIPVIALSGRVDVKDETYKEAGFDLNLLKPYKPEALKKAILELLEVEHTSTAQSQSINNQNGKFQKEDYDITEIYEFSGNDEDAMNTIIQAFLQGAESSKKEMAEAYQQGDKEKMGRIAHKMLPMLRQMKAKRLIPLLSNIEGREEVNEKDFKRFLRDLENFMDQLNTGTTV